MLPVGLYEWKITTAQQIYSSCVRPSSYEPSFFPSFYSPSAKRAGHENKEGKKTKIHNLPYGPSKRG